MVRMRGVVVVVVVFTHIILINEQCQRPDVRNQPLSYSGSKCNLFPPHTVTVNKVAQTHKINTKQECPSAPPLLLLLLLGLAMRRYDAAMLRAYSCLGVASD